MFCWLKAYSKIKMNLGHLQCGQEQRIALSARQCRQEDWLNGISAEAREEYRQHQCHCRRKWWNGLLVEGREVYCQLKVWFCVVAGQVFGRKRNLQEWGPFGVEGWWRCQLGTVVLPVRERNLQWGPSVVEGCWRYQLETVVLPVRERNLRSCQSSGIGGVHQRWWVNPW